MIISTVLENLIEDLFYRFSLETCTPGLSQVLRVTEYNSITIGLYNYVFNLAVNIYHYSSLKNYSIPWYWDIKMYQDLISRNIGYNSELDVITAIIGVYEARFLDRYEFK